MKTFTLLACALVGATAAFAQLVPADYQAAGDHLLARDFSTRLEWLNVPLTFNRSYAQTKAELAPGGAFAGFRFATQDEFTQLYLSQGIPTATWDAPEGFDTTVFSRVFALQASLGFANRTDPNAAQDIITAGFLFTPKPPPGSERPADRAFGDLEVIDFDSPSSADFYRAHTYFVEPFTDTTVGSFLVRSFTPVPEPSTYAVGALACLALAALKRWRRDSAWPAASD